MIFRRGQKSGLLRFGAENPYVDRPSRDLEIEYNAILWLSIHYFIYSFIFLYLSISVSVSLCHSECVTSVGLSVSLSLSVCLSPQGTSVWNFWSCSTFGVDRGHIAAELSFWQFNVFLFSMTCHKRHYIY